MERPVKAALRDHSSDLRRLRWLLIGVLLALLIPTAILASRAYNQLGYESLHRYRLTSENIAQSIEAGLQGLLATEAAHDVGQYSFFLSQPGSDRPVLSPLAQLGSDHQIPGQLGHFLISASGELQTPLLPTQENLALSEWLSVDQIRQRRSWQQQIGALVASLALEVPAPVAPAQEQDVAQDTMADAVAEVFAGQESAELAAPTEAEAVYQRDLSSSGGLLAKNANQQVFERLSGMKKERAQKTATTSSDDSVASSFSLNQDYLRRRQAPGAAPRGAAAIASGASPPLSAERAEQRFEWFMRTDGVLQYLPVGGDHLLLYRRSWQTGTQVILGLILEREALFAALIDTPFLAARDNNDLRLTLADGARAIRSVEAVGRPVAYSKSLPPKPGGQLLYRSRLPAPFSDLQLVFSATQVGIPPGGAWIVGSSALLIALLLSGFALIYRLGVRELQRRATQQNFVSAVSHELKTPLTAIRMYGEMLKSGWVPEEKKPGYYDFIFSESERLSRLISNVLRLSQVSRDRLALNPEPHSAAELVDVARSKLQSLADAGSAELIFDLPETLADAMVVVDMDALAQVLINLVDNAIKFGGERSDQRLIIALQGLPSNLPGDRRELQLSVRDFGPGIPKAQLGQIFDLFYRGEGAVAQQIQGTGIGLALVAELVAGMNGSVTAANAEPGACFSVHLPIAP